jgi:hypothetical protein
VFPCGSISWEAQHQQRARVAQLDRVPGFEPVGWGFESLRGRHLRINEKRRMSFELLSNKYSWGAPVRLNEKRRMSFELLSNKYSWGAPVRLNEKRRMSFELLSNKYSWGAPVRLNEKRRMSFELLSRLLGCASEAKNEL